ncbi:SusC/RagA family TonB-linked outer membrane protein [Chitinophaga arvensicola]|uniref:TonB-linked outer membrane protein, SusC/RagA family n=1 Tax=Chitinophaga arvensicola TaxID=29529 RepID=A0A1I0PYE3_9BACT|nr:SusC/RagA family TonB-linked outer membrane protein [Chitinophaga arvensicola]SEW19445.1 TonB-linked outer membrane protein, SusC/RagA family [Chitinophaga arvensicola]
MAISVVHAYAQTKLISGKVTDAKDGAGLPGVSVGIKGTGKGALTSNDGSYKLEVPNGSVLVFSFIGYSSKEVPVGSESTINVSLGTDNKDLSEVVVTALGIKREKRTLGYATQEVKGDDIVQTKEVNFLNGLQGKVAGVQINNTSGMPGGGTRILIRGSSSLTGNNQPLFVVDGNPISNDQIGAGDDDPVRAGGTTANRGIDIDPNIIESVNILRGASATALYGSRAAGGAVIITTKKGSKKGSFNLVVGSSTTIDKVILPEFQDQWGQGTNGVFNSTTSQSWGGPRMDTFKINGQLAPKYDPRKMFFKTGTTLDNSLSLNGTTDKSSYLFSYSSLRQEGVAPTTDYYRNAFYGNFATNLTEKLKMTIGVNYIDSRNHRLTEGNYFSGYLSSLYFEPISFNPYPIKKPDNTQNLYAPTTANNPFWASQNIGLDLNVRRVIPNVLLEYSPLNWLTFTERLGADVYTERRTFQEGIGSVGSFPNGRMYNETVNSQQVNHDFYVTGRKNFDKLDLTVMVGNNIISEYYTDEFTKGIGLSVEDFYDISNAESVSSKLTYYNRRRVSLYAQAILEYNRMLSLTLTGRNDWSSSLPAGGNSYFYPSATAAFIFSELGGLKDSKALSFGKLRVGYTGIGNDAPPYKVSNRYFKTSVTDALDGTITIPFNGANAFSLNNILGNPNLKPERIREFEVGLETKWLNNRIGLDVSYYNKVSKDLIYETDISAAAGFQSAVINAGKITNKGIEVTLTATPVQTKNFNWNIAVNYSKNKSMINELSEAVSQIQIGGFTSPGIYLIAGQPYGTIMGTRQARDASGKKLIDDDGYPIQDPNGDGMIGNIQPRWIGGVTNTVSYKGFDLSFTFDGRFGGDILNLDEYYLTGGGQSIRSANREGTTILDGVRESDGKPNTTVIKTDQTYYRSYWRNMFENVVQDGTFVKLRNVTLAYNFSSKLLEKTFIKGATISVAGRNLWLYKPNYTGSDPELSLYGSGSNSGGFVNFVSPSTRSYNATVKLTF